MSNARSRLSAVHAQIQPSFVEKAESAAHTALAANAAAARDALLGEVPRDKATELGEQTISVIASSILHLVEQAEKDDAKVTLLHAIQAFQQCLRSAAAATGEDALSRLQDCCAKHLKLRPERCRLSALLMEQALQKLRRTLPSQHAYNTVVDALFTKKARRNWELIVAGAIVGAAGLAGAARYQRAKAQHAKNVEDARAKYRDAQAISKRFSRWNRFLLAVLVSQAVGLARGHERVAAALHQAFRTGLQTGR